MSRLSLKSEACHSSFTIANARDESDMRGGSGSDRPFAYDAAEKPSRYAPDSAAFASAPPVAQDARFAAAPLQYAPMPQAAPAAPYAQHYPPPQQQAHMYQPQQQRASSERFPGGYHHESVPPAPLQQQQSFPYYPPGQFAPRQQQQQQPLLPQFTNQSGYPPYPPSGAAFGPVVRRKPQRLAKHRALRQLLQLVGFHVLNSVLGISAFSLLGSGVSSSVSLLPLCCFGVIVFRVVLYGVHVLAQFDVMLVNFIAPPHAKVFLEVPTEPGLVGLVLAPSLESFSPLSLMALLYFLSVKFGVALLSLSSAAMSVVPLGLLVFVVCGGQNVDLLVGSSRFSYQHDKTAFVVATLCLTVIGCALMVLAAKVSTKATKFFCCESFSTLGAHIGYQQHARQQRDAPQQRYAYSASAQYGAT